MTATLESILAPHRVEIPAHLEADAEVPLLAGMQRQGDVLVRPTAKIGKAMKAEALPAEGAPVVRGEAGGNTHLLVGDPDVRWAPAGEALLDLGTVCVPEGSAAYLIHPEHGATGMAPGTYRISRQREQADEIRRVAD